MNSWNPEFVPLADTELATALEGFRSESAIDDRRVKGVDGRDNNRANEMPVATLAVSHSDAIAEMAPPARATDRRNQHPSARATLRVWRAVLIVVAAVLTLTGAIGLLVPRTPMESSDQAGGEGRIEIPSPAVSTIQTMAVSPGDRIAASSPVATSGTEASAPPRSPRAAPSAVAQTARVAAPVIHPAIHPVVSAAIPPVFTPAITPVTPPPISPVHSLLDPALGGAISPVPPPNLVVPTSPSVSAPPPTSPPVRADETRAIEAVLGQYRAAFNDLDSSEAARIWPRLDKGSLDRAFRQVREQTLFFDNCEIQRSGVLAEASCSGQLHYVPAIGSTTPRTEVREWKFLLRKTEGGWVVDRVNAR